MDTGSIIMDELRLNDEERGALAATIHTLPALDVFSVNDGLFEQLRDASTRIPLRIEGRLRQFRVDSGIDGVLLLRNLPTDAALPRTPADGRPSADKRTRVSELNLLLLMMHLGEPIAYEDEKAGALIQDICPIVGHEHKQESSGTDFLDFHTEDGFHPCKPDRLALTCLRADPAGQAMTQFASMRRVLPSLSAQVIDALRRPAFRIRHAASFMKAGQPPVWSPPLPVVSGEGLELQMCVDFHAMEALDRPAALALATLEEALIAVRVGCRLMPGDLVVIDNRVVAHARTAFPASHDGNDRWLQRLFVVEDFARTQSMRREREHVCRALVELSPGLR